ncbi:hypothetical protein DBV15_07922 [Temnothorax longispinosus]|uniref:DUF1907 domain-containing protein n=1 Tax=Temnothorax longispinosus TaxID=300112 RepID=A0A4S2JR69_9HYME|nr:hypothetical protein DBV15_07922 [Temnothorax longispinosus]
MAMQNDNVNNNMQNDDNLPEVIDMTCSLHQPSLKELASVMNLSLAHHFNHVAVNVVECPNLLTSPYFLPAPGICGDAQVIEFGNHEHLYNPSKNKRVSWILPQYINQYTSGTCHVIGNTMSRGIPNKDRLNNLECINLAELEISTEHICKTLQNNPQIREIELGDMNDAILIELGNSCRDLEVIHTPLIISTVGDITIQGINALANCKNLQKVILYLDECPITDDSIFRLLSSYQDLQELELFFPVLSNHRLELLAQCKNLKKLFIHTAELDIPDKYSIILRQCPKLQEFFLTRCNFYTVNSLSRHILQNPNEQLKGIMNVHLAPYFNHVAANVIECPDLLAPPYFLRAPGICGDAQVIEFGNEEHLYNTSKNKEVSWFLPQYINRYTRGSCLVIGNTMSREIPNKNVGMNFMHSSESEEQLIALNEQESNYIFLNEEGQVETQCHPWGPVYCDLYGSVYVCNGKQDKVLEVYVKGGRDPNVEILNLMRSALRFRYHFLADSARVGLSGLLFITSGKVLASVMPRTFSQTLLQNEEEINGWNRNFKLSAPVIVHSTMFNFNELNIIHNKRLYREKAVDYTDLPGKQIVQPYITDVEATSSEQTGTEDHSDDFANTGLSRSAVHASEERGSNDVSTTDSSSSGSIYATPLSETSIRLESTDKYPFGEYPSDPSHESGYTEDALLVENAGNFGEKVQDQPRDGTIVRTVIQISEGRKDDEHASFPKPYINTVSPLENEDTRKRPYASATQKPFVLAVKEESNLADDSFSDDIKLNSETSAENSDEVFSKITTESSPSSNIASILENDVVPEILPTPLARLSRARNDTADEKTIEKSMESAKKSETVVRTSTTVEIIPSFQARFSGPIVVADLPDRETREMIADYMDDASETYRQVENAEIISETNAEGFKTAASASITSSAMLNPLQVGITLVNANQADLTNNNEQSAMMNIEEYPQDDPQQDLQRLATVDEDFVRDNGNQSLIDYQDESFERDEVEKRAEVDIQKVPNDSVEIQKSVEIYHTAPVHEIHYPPEYIQQTTNLGVIETNNIGSSQRSEQPYNQIEQSEVRSTYDSYQGNDQGEKSVVKAHASTFPQKLNQYEYNALENDVGKPTASAVGAEYSSSTHEQTSLELQPTFKYNSMQSVGPVLFGPNQFDDTLYDQSNVRHNFNGNDNGIPPRVKPVETATRQETASELVNSYVPSTYQYSQLQQPQSNQPIIIPVSYTHLAATSYAVPSFGRQFLYNLVEKDKQAVKDEYVGPAPPRKTSQSKMFSQIKSPQFSTSSQSLALRKSRQPETQHHHGSFRQSKMEYGFKPPMVPSIQYDENTASKVEN